jgi:dTDP-4-amino-4,6-dideoxygalactose transaminase
MTVPFVDLKSQYKQIKDEIAAAIQPILDNAQYILGPAVEEFEKNFSRFLGVKHTVAVSSGTDALHLALRAAGISPGDEIITAANTFIATAEAISLVGAKPVFVDCREDDYLMDISQVESKINSKTRAIIPVHLYSQAVDMDKLIAIAAKHNLYLIEDACQAHGSEYKGKKLGTLGLMGCFSFYPGKNLGAYGDGGAVTTNNSALAEKLKKLRDHGSEKKYSHELIGGTFRLDGIQGAILNVKLKHLADWNSLRRQHAEKYKQLLSNMPEIILPIEPPYSRGTYHLFVIRVKNRDELQKYLTEQGIQTGIHYPIPIHFQRAYGFLNLSPGTFPVAEQAAKEIISLPMYPELVNEQIEYVCKKITEFYRK